MKKKRLKKKKIILSSLREIKYINIYISEKTLNKLVEVNHSLNITNELHTQIYSEVFFNKNTVNLRIDKKNSGITYNVFREVIK